VLLAGEAESEKSDRNTVNDSVATWTVLEIESVPVTAKM
jgi:hypothetical protein